MYIKSPLKSTQFGISLLEVLITLLVITVGVLGLTKMQALSLANTYSSSARGLIALQASSLAASLRGNSVYWQGGAGAALCTNNACSFSGSSTATFGVAPALSSCQASVPLNACTGAQIAALDTNTWMANINAHIPSYSALLNCSGTPTLCSIQINWYEKTVGMNASTAALSSANTSVQQSYYLYVQP